jgi:membrane protein
MSPSTTHSEARAAALATVGADKSSADADASTAAARKAAESGEPGANATKPTEIPKEGWKQILKRAYKETQDDNIPIIAAGVAFYGFLALFPTLIAAITIYGLVASPQQIEGQINSIASALPQDAASIVTDQLKTLAAGSGGALTFGLVASLLGALWAASGGMGNLIKAVNIAYDEEDTRGFIKGRALALLLTLGAIVFFLGAIALVAVLPIVFDAIGLGGFARFAAGVARWVGLVVFVLVALAIVYRYAPDRDNPRFSWTSIGAVAATVLWVLGSVGFTLYVTQFGNYQKTYGALAGVAVLLLWMWLTSYIVLFGAEVNSEMEHQTMRDTTTGPEKLMGERDAVMADTYPPDPQDKK